ncbi:MAG: hypothetical protein U5M51_16670 [Emticicia sp.]|nr:hypothetical protein [Emticicia sp.]
MSGIGWKLIICLNVASCTVARSITPNVLGLCEEADLEAQMFNLAQMYLESTNVQFSTEPAFSQNPC